MSPATLLECTEVEVVSRRLKVLGKKMPGSLAGVHSRVRSHRCAIVMVGRVVKC